jgi:hypothetical protein
MQCCPESGVPATDHADFRFLIRLEGYAANLFANRRRVVRLNVLI